jgi:hypothetical protein
VAVEDEIDQEDLMVPLVVVVVVVVVQGVEIV